MQKQTDEQRPWYKEPWPWVAIAIPAAAVIMGITTYYLAVTNPDYLVVEEQEYHEIKSELRAQQSPGEAESGQESAQNDSDGAL